MHPAFTYIPSFLSPPVQQKLLTRCLALFSAPAHTTSSSRRLLRNYLAKHPHERGSPSFYDDAAYSFESRHFDGVIQGYRELLVKGQLVPDSADQSLRDAVNKFYALIPPPPTTPVASTSATTLDPPPHAILHLLHLSSTGAIYPHVDNLNASGGTIVGLSLGSSRVMKFKRTGPPATSKEEEEEPDEFEVLLEPGSVYIQTARLRTHYTHEIPVEAQWEGQRVGAAQRISLMLRDRLPDDNGQ